MNLETISARKPLGDGHLVSIGINLRPLNPSIVFIYPLSLMIVVIG